MHGLIIKIPTNIYTPRLLVISTKILKLDIRIEYGLL